MPDIGSLLPSYDSSGPLQPDVFDPTNTAGNGLSIMDVLHQVSAQLSAVGGSFPGSSGGMSGPATGIIRPAWMPQMIPQTRQGGFFSGVSADPRMPAGTPVPDLNPYSSSLSEDSPVFMGKYVHVDADEEDVALQAGTDVDRRTIRGLQGTDDPFTSKGATKKGPRFKDVRKPQTITLSQAMLRPSLWSDDRIEQVMAKMRDAGYDVTSVGDMEDTWSSLVQRAATTFNASQGKKEVTPWDMLALDKRIYKNQGGAGADGADKPFTGDKTFRSSSVNKISLGDGWSTMRSAVSSLLGRDPSDQEVRDFVYRMNHEAAQDPSISETVRHYKKGNETGSDTRVVDPGMTANDVARAAYDQAQDDPDYGAFQAASTYWNLLVGALGPTTGG